MKGEKQREKGTRPFPTTSTSLEETGETWAREAMSVTSGNYARVPVAIGLLILLGAALAALVARARAATRQAHREQRTCSWRVQGGVGPGGVTSWPDWSAHRRTSYRRSLRNTLVASRLILSILFSIFDVAFPHVVRDSVDFVI